MTSSIEDRQFIFRDLYRELVGPLPGGSGAAELDTGEQPIAFATWEEAYGPFVEKGTGEEVLQRDTPTKRYGIGLLHPIGSVDEEGQKGVDALGTESSEGMEGQADVPAKAREEYYKRAEAAREKASQSTGDDNPDDLDLSTANSYKPSSMGISFLAELPPDSKLVIDATGGRYRPMAVTIAGIPRTWWLRRGVSLHAEFTAEDIAKGLEKVVKPTAQTSENAEGASFGVEAYARPFSAAKSKIRLLTVCLVNRSSESGQENILFQSHFKVSVVAQDGQKHILPYPEAEISRLDDEEKSMALLYRHERTFAIGHGCAASWDYKAHGEKTDWLAAECLPFVETASITPDVQDEAGKELRVAMAPLAGLVDGDDGYKSLDRLITSYERWIEGKESELSGIEPILLRQTAEDHLRRCRRCLERMRNGLVFLRSNAQAAEAFKLANRAILEQQVHSRSEPRRVEYDPATKRFVFPEPYTKPDGAKALTNQGSWRAFQIAFLLTTIESVADAWSEERDIVELIWFPTGGGKTEAYLGLAAFALIWRRLSDPQDDGVEILMRYTLRLLTTQQFTRASRLICALEEIRRGGRLGERPFSIGLWVGGANTPNTRREALSTYKDLAKGDRHTQNKFVLDRCPWCGAQMGPLDDEQARRSKVHLLGYHQVVNSVVFRCPDKACEFHSGLPILVTDEEIYEQPPSMVIGTVDKFAMLTWKPQARAIFGIAPDGSRLRTPPGLIIQDELHLISGPLGSVVGLYETLIEELCTDRRPTSPARPKIVSSTATIRRYKEQIAALYAREHAELFPPPGIDIDDSFFSRYARQADGSLAPGKLYVGVNAPGLGSMQTVQVRCFTALLQAPMELSEDSRDPWWTLLVFFNSLRELGTTLSLLQSDIPDYQQVLVNRLPSSRRQWRYFGEIVELTGRANSEDIPKAIASLEKQYSDGKQHRAVDVCLASNILEVGVDIERLSLMAVVGQPKTTSQYIQVTGRIGRNWQQRPGMVVTLYSASKPRDRSHFEKFISYHQRLYAQVEPTSVTPFSAPALLRVLHALMIGYVRQTGDENATRMPDPYPEDLIEALRQIARRRVDAVDEEEISTFEAIFETRANQWRTVRPITWDAEPGNSDDVPLMKVAGTFFDTTSGQLPFPTMQSMRTVDAECVAEVRLPQAEGEGDDA